MDNKAAELTNDWSQNWNESIAVKLTAIILWSVMIAAFVFTVPVMLSYEGETLKEYLWTNQKLVNLVEKSVNRQESVVEIGKKLQEYIDRNEIEYIAVKINAADVSVGVQIDNGFQFPVTRFSSEDSRNVSVHIQHPNLKRVLIVDRVILGVSIVAGAMIFGLFILLVTRKVIHNPMRNFVDITHKISEGDKDSRFDETRDDEFGELARFSNQMLGNLELHREKMAESNRELVSEIGHREEALAASQQKSAFLANMSHEIRTPLSSIIGYTERLRYKDIKNKDERNSMMDVVLHSGKHLLNLINDILDLSKIEANKLEMESEKYSIVEIVESTVHLLHDKAMEQSTQLKIEYEFPLPKNIKNDSTRTKQVLLNLCGNALRFTKDGVITISVSFDQTKNRMFVAIKDTGIGMSEEVLAKLFKPFSQADVTTSKNYGGTGLGLVISRRLCELMGGEISVKSTEGLGSIFTFSIEAGFEPADELVSEVDRENVFFRGYDKPNDNVSFSGKVLLVEDTTEIRILVKAYLEDYGVEVSTAENGKEGVAMAFNGDFDAILMDIHMPVMNGKEAVKYLRTNDYTGPVIALTADALTQQVEEYKELGFTSILTKPVIINDLIDTLGKHLEYATQTVEAESLPSSCSNQPVPTKSHNEIMSPLNSELGKRLVKKFISSIPSTMQDIDIAIDRRDIESLKDIFHQLKGVGGSIGFPMVTDLATEVEEPLANENYDAVKLKNVELNDIYNRICAVA